MLRFRPRNNSTVWASDPHIGVLGEGFPRGGADIAKELLASVDGGAGLRILQESLSPVRVLHPFQSGTPLEVRLEPPSFGGLAQSYTALRNAAGHTAFSLEANLRVVWRGAVFVFCREAAPEWWQATWVLTISGHDFGLSSTPRCTIERPAGLPCARTTIEARHLSSNEWIVLDPSRPENVRQQVAS